MIKGAGFGARKHYTTLEVSYIIHTFYSSYSMERVCTEDSQFKDTNTLNKLMLLVAEYGKILNTRSYFFFLRVPVKVYSPVGFPLRIR